MAAFVRTYGKRWQFEHNLPDKEERRDREPSPVKRVTRPRQSPAILMTQQGESAFQADNLTMP